MSLSGCDVCSFPTSGVLVHIDNLRWEGVPFILMSGKALDERVGYVRIVFKNRAYCTQSERHWVPEQSRCLPQQIIFYIGHGDLGHPAILVSRNLFKPSLPTQKWKEVQDQPGLRLFGRPLSDYYAYRPVREQDAYSTLLSHIFHCRKESFITTENLLASWVFWTPLLDSLAFEVPRPYPGGAENGQLLDFEFSGGQLTFSQQQLEVLIPDLGSVPKPSDFQVLGARYRQSPLITAWPEELISKLASDIEAAAVQAVRHFGKFHLALSGGSSPIALFQQLATGHYSFPWAHTHLWLVDERCVPLSDPDSNFQGLQAHLLQHVRVPYYNIHPMPVHLHQRLCAEEDQGAQTYASEISALVANSSFDLVLLGMGTDGHTASLFPQSPTGLDGDQLVVLTESPFRPHQRMSLSLPLINRAKKKRETPWDPFLACFAQAWMQVVAVLRDLAFCSCNIREQGALHASGERVPRLCVTILNNGRSDVQSQDHGRCCSSDFLNHHPQPAGLYVTNQSHLCTNLSQEGALSLKTWDTLYFLKKFSLKNCCLQTT
uniref:6-phosphogluconolactonase n=1 Tax=Mus spicilegus TaxID=10103 RepID=A0A8C6H2V6_MUSSI